ncbi:hypothetical protein IQ229_01240 [Nostoc cf. edaphicum LEGE 07299]|uniref:Uncharacterized protein n=1 Tax=Nostoc cf. edaphicum LEGE 07299 TaxID=2777974 RepID=A0ABR9TT75_9NOSO|nr:hypothetical protein [Nostoc edaphicum]MBE9103615.1 hypothetical protein [Nostoc cf. edaphicum LEGE 07299]
MPRITLEVSEELSQQLAQVGDISVVLRRLVEERATYTAKMISRKHFSRTTMLKISL